MTETQRSWRVFVSHSSVDKDRFVEPFAHRLRLRGIDAWLDKWEILPGDSLIDRIFNEGLRNADACIVVLSPASIQSAWVHKELNTATVQSIENDMKLIPILIEDCEIPTCLKDKLYVKVTDVSAYNAEFERIVAAIENRALKPALGIPPNYARQSLPRIQSLEHNDIAVLKELGDRVLKMNREVYRMVQQNDLREIEASCGLSTRQLQETLTIFQHMGFTSRWQGNSQEIGWVQLSQLGFRNYLDSFYSKFSEETQQVLLAIVNQSLTSDAEIAAATTSPIVIVRFLLKELKNKGFLRLSELNTGCEICNLSPTLRRALQNGGKVV